MHIKPAVTVALATLLAGCGPVVTPSADFTESPGGDPSFVPGENVHVMPKRGLQSFAGGGPAHLTYYGGHVLSNVKVYAVFWGGGTNATVKNGIGAFYSAVTNSVHMDWLSEYDTNITAAGGGAGTNQHIGRGSFGGAFTIAPAVGGANLTDAQIQSEINSQINGGHLPAPDANTIYMVHFPPGDVITKGSGRSCVGGGFCAYHGTFSRNGQSVFYGVLPDMSPGSGCDTGCGSNASMFNNQTSVASHELIEAVTDAEVGLASQLAPPLAWYDNTPGNGEIGDICNAVQGTINDTGTVYTVQAEWSNVSNACIVSRAAPPPAGPLTNGDFEKGNLSSWTVATGTVTAVNGGAHGGSFSAQIGSQSAFGGDSTLTQTVVVPNSGTVTLSFWYAPHCNDTIQYDWQQAQVRDVNGATLIKMLNDCSNTGAWTHLTADLTPYKGKNVVLWFNDHDDNNPGDPNWFNLDDVTISTSAPDNIPPTTTVTAPASGATVSGAVTVTATATDNVGVAKIELYVDGALLASGAASPTSATWDTTKAVNGTHTVQSKAYDGANNVGTSALVSVKVANMMGGPQNLITNGGFEGSLNGWTLGGQSTPIDSVAQKHTGNNSLRCGALTQNGAQEFSGDSFAYQTIAIPGNISTATLTFWYFTATTDTIQWDWQDAQVRNANGQTLLNIFHVCDNTQQWIQKTVDLTPYKGTTVQIWFNGHGDGGTDPTVLWVDDVALNVQ